MSGLLNGNGNGNGHDGGNQALADLDLESTRHEMNSLIGLDSIKDPAIDHHEAGSFSYLDHDTSEPDMEETKPRFWEKGSSHIFFVGAGTLLLVLLVASILGGLSNRSHGPTQIASKPTDPSKNAFFSSTPKDNVGDWKTQAALAEQKAQFQNRQQPSKEKGDKVASIKVPPAPTPAPRPAYVPQMPVYRPSYVPQTPARQAIAAPVIPAYMPPSPSAQFPAIAAAPPKAPTLEEANQKWSALGKLASWGADDNAYGSSLPTSPAPNFPTPPAPNINPTPPVANGGFRPTSYNPPAATTGYTPAVYNNPQIISQAVPPSPTQTQSTAPIPDESAVFSGVPRKMIPIGASASGHLDTPVVTAGGNTADRFVVTLTQPLKASDGSIALPKNSQLIIAVDTVSGAGLMGMSVVTAKTPDGNEVNIPQGAIQVRGKSGRPLVAKNLNKAKTGGGNSLARALGMFAMGGITSQAQLLGQSASTVSVANGSTTVTNGSPNFLGGLIGGGTQAIMPSIQQSVLGNNQGNTQYAQGSQGPLWSVDSGAPVEVFVNQVVSV